MFLSRFTILTSRSIHFHSIHTPLLVLIPNRSVDFLLRSINSQTSFHTLTAQTIYSYSFHTPTTPPDSSVPNTVNSHSKL